MLGYYENLRHTQIYDLLFGLQCQGGPPAKLGRSDRNKARPHYRSVGLKGHFISNIHMLAFNQCLHSVPISWACADQYELWTAMGHMWRRNLNAAKQGWNVLRAKSAPRELRLGLIFASSIVLSRKWPGGLRGLGVQWGHDSAHRAQVAGSCFRVRKSGAPPAPLTSQLSKGTFLSSLVCFLTS